jgi:preprotein translocase subunit YajC
MASFAFLSVGFLSLLIPIVLLGILIYVIVKRIQDKDDERFEKRDN